MLKSHTEQFDGDLFKLLKGKGGGGFGTLPGPNVMKAFTIILGIIVTVRKIRTLGNTLMIMRTLKMITANLRTTIQNA